MYSWGTNTKPAVPFMGQIYVDAKFDLWQWGGDTWLLRNLWSFRQVDAQTIHAAGLPVTSPFLRSSAMRLEAQWDIAYGLAFVEVEVRTTGAVHRRALMTRANLTTWLATVVPNDGSSYTSSFLLRIYEVFDPYMKLDRANTWNVLYSSMRGRGCYRKGLRRSRFGLPSRGGLPPMFKSSWPGAADLPRELVNFFFGVMPPALADADMSIIYTGRGIDLYSQPTNNGMQTSIPIAGYKCWNTSLGGWDDAPLGTWRTSGGLPNSPAVVWTELGSLNLQVGVPSQVLRGLYQLKNAVWAVVVYLVRHTSLDKYAFYIKPLGVTHMAFDTELDPASWELVCENVYRGDANHIRHRVVSVDDRRDVENGWRFNISTAVDPSVASGTVGGALRSLDSSMAPKNLQFYVRNRTSGLRSELASTTIEIVKRTNNAPIRFSERRGRF